MQVPSGIHGFTRVKPYLGPAGARKSETENPHRACFSARGPAKIGEKQEPPLRKSLRSNWSNSGQRLRARMELSAGDQCLHVTTRFFLEMFLKLIFQVF